MSTQPFAQAIACWQSGRHGEAEALCRAAIQGNPADADAYQLLAQILAASGRLEGALAVRRGRVRALLALRQSQAALTACEELLAAHPALPGVRHLRAHALLALQRLPEALTAAREAIVAEPTDIQAHLALGLAALTAGSPLALFCYEQALSLQPTLATAHAGRGMALIASGREMDAIDALARAVQLDPQAATSVFLQAGYQMLQLGHPDSAHAAFSKLLALQPDQRAAQEGRVIALIAMRRYEEAAPELSALRDAAPLTDYLSGICLHAQLQCCDWTDFDNASRAITERVRRGERADTPLTFIVHNDSPADQRLCAQTYVAHKCSPDAPPFQRPPRPAGARLRIGYVSSDFRDHAVSQLTVGVFESHNRARFETYAFSTGPNDASKLRQRVERSFDHFLEVAALSDMQIASRMAELSIDIAVDLGGHSMGGRPRVLAYRPAPMQVGFLGFPGTLGADFIDYLIADRHVIQERDRSHYVEQIIYLPDTYLPTDGAPVMNTPPGRTQAGLPAHGFVYCCFNAPYKISPAVFDVWMRLLKAVPNSVLWLRNASATVKNNLAREAQRRGVDGSRLVYAPRTETRAGHFSRLALADVFLDTQPYNAHTTASDALGAGVPIITMRGKTFASRVASSLLGACDLGHLAVETPQEYEQLAIELAFSPDTVAALKGHLLRARTSAPLFDTTRFCRHLEAAYLEIWARHLRAERPATLWVKPIAQ